MKQFTFRLESVLKTRAREEARAREEYEHLEHARQRAERALSEAQAELDRCQSAIAVHRFTRMTPNDHLILLNSAAVQRDYCERLSQRLASAAKEAEHQRAELVKAKRAHEAILRLKERQRRAHDADERRREENEIGDLITARHALGQEASIS